MYIDDKFTGMARISVWSSESSDGRAGGEMVEWRIKDEKENGDEVYAGSMKDPWAVRGKGDTDV